MSNNSIATKFIEFNRYHKLLNNRVSCLFDQTEVFEVVDSVNDSVRGYKFDSIVDGVFIRGFIPFTTINRVIDEFPDSPFIRYVNSSDRSSLFSVFNRRLHGVYNFVEFCSRRGLNPGFDLVNIVNSIVKNRRSVVFSLHNIVPFVIRSRFVSCLLMMFKHCVLYVNHDPDVCRVNAVVEDATFGTGSESFNTFEEFLSVSNILFNEVVENIDVDSEVE